MPVVPRRREGTPVEPAPPPPSTEYAEIASNDPQGVADRASMFLDSLSDGPISSALVGAIKGAAVSPIARVGAHILGAASGAATGRPGETAAEFDDFLTALGARTRADKATLNGRMVGAFVPEAVAYAATAGAGASLGSAGARIAARSTAVERYFMALADPLLPGLPKPAIVRAGEILGTGLAVGAQAGGEAAAIGEPDPLATALKVGGATIALEGGFTGLAKAVSRGASEVNKLRIAERFATSEPKKYLHSLEDEFKQKLVKQVGRVRSAIQEEAVERQLQGMTPLAIPAAAPQKVAKQFAAAQRRGLAEATATRVEAVRKMHQASGSLQVARQHANIGERDILAGAYLSERPTNFDSTFGSWRKLQREIASTPDGIRKEIGVVGEYAMRQVDNATLLGFGRGNSSIEVLDRLRRDVRNIVGSKRANDVLFAWEEGGETAVRQLLADLPRASVDRVMRSVNLVSGGMDALHQILVRAGAEAAINPAEMRVANYLPHMVQRGIRSDAAYQKSLERHLIKNGHTPEAATRRALDVIEARKAKGFQFFGSVDERRTIPGSARAKIASGIPLEADPWQSVAQYYIGMHQRIALSQVLGFKNEMIDPLVRAVALEAGPGGASLFRSSIESMAGLKYYNRLREQFATSVTNIEAAAKMGFSFVPNAFQAGLNNPLVFGIRNTFTGMQRMVRGSAPEDLKRAMGFMATDFFDLGLRSHMMGGMREGVTAKLARFTLSGSGFNMTERFNRGSAAFGGHAVLTDILTKASTGRLRGSSLTFARKVFEEAGMDLGTILKEGISEEQYITGVLRLMRRTQFSAGEGTRAIRPLAWQTPLGRVMMQFNTFTLNQGRLMRDFVFNEIAKGNKRQLARFLGIYMPMAEVSVATQRAVEEAVTGKERPRPDAPVVRALEDILYAGSFGMASTMYWASVSGRVERLTGPFINDVFTYGNALLGGRFDEIGSRLSRLPSVRYFSTVAAIGYRGGEELRRAAEQYNEAFGVEGDHPARDEATLRDFQSEPGRVRVRRRGEQ